MLINLLLNAAQAIEPGSPETNKVTVTTRTDDEGNAQIDVSDTGPGMSASVMARIFEPFFTTKPVGVGTGLGLAICRGLVTSLGGELSVDSKVGFGSTFHLRLPTASSTTTSPRSETRTRYHARARVLLIDDDELVLHAMARALDGHAVVCKSDPRAALELLEGDQAFDVIFVDMLMPGMSAAQFYMALSKESPLMARRVVFMTGGVTDGAAAAFLAGVKSERLEKPFGPGELEAVVERAISQRA